VKKGFAGPLHAAGNVAVLSPAMDFCEQPDRVMCGLLISSSIRPAMGAA
jgi:hypothetical protein